METKTSCISAILEKILKMKGQQKLSDENRHGLRRKKMDNTAKALIWTPIGIKSGS